jgi:hypothetical protein
VDSFVYFADIVKRKFIFQMIWAYFYYAMQSKNNLRVFYMSSQETFPDTNANTDNNKNSFSRFIQIGDWLFEIKMVRALKVNEYGLPYEAIANCNINGDSMYIDGLLTKNDKDFSREDFATFCQFGHQVGVDNISYHRYQNGESVTKNVKVRSPESIKKSTEITSEFLFDQVIPMVK